MQGEAIAREAFKQRFDEVFPRHVVADGLAAHSADELRRLSAKYGFRYVVIDRARSRRPLPFVRVFPEIDSGAAAYEVYLLPE